MKISIAKDPAGYYLTVELNRSVEPAGERLFKGGTPPSIKFRHTDQASAVIDAGKLQRYVDEINAKRAKR